MSLVGPSMPVDVHHSGPEAHRELAKKSLEDREILGHGCGIYPWISRALRLIRGVGGTQGQLSESDPTWAANRVARHRCNDPSRHPYFFLTKSPYHLP